MMVKTGGDQWAPQVDPREGTPQYHYAELFLVLGGDLQDFAEAICMPLILIRVAGIL